MKINELGDIDSLEPGQRQKFNPSNTDYSRSFDKFLLDCSDSIAAAKEADKFLLRGVASGGPQIFLGRSRDNRKPLDSDKLDATMMDDYLKASGFTALRSNSIFCTGSLYGVGKYGTVYIIFPVNGFDITWSPKVHDFTNYVAAHKPGELYKFADSYDNYTKLGYVTQGFIYHTILRELHSNNMAIPYNDKRRKPLEKLKIALSPYTRMKNFYSIPDVKKIITILQKIDLLVPGKISAQEAISKLEEYAIAAKTSSDPSKVKPQEVISSLAYKNTDLAGALKSGHEILIHGKYYAFHAKKYAYELRKELGVDFQ
jgi:hypothetical protein